MANKWDKLKDLQFRHIQLLKDKVLGIGSYGKVCKAECDGLLCAAKIIHETLSDPTAQQLIAPHREHRLPMRRFEQECEFLSTIRHPNIIQYLGMYQDPDTYLPVLLMELMDDSLTHFLESSPQLIPYHIQVNICHDVTLALSFLHSNGIVHRDLSCNNVLMIGNIRAKVTDFGMARLGDINPRATHLTFTMCPGTDVYMPPEAVKDNPVYTEKIDCFSFGVIAIQTMTRLFPQPGDRRKEIEIENVGLVEKRISEQERRQNHISKIDPSHPLLAAALDCLKDEQAERPDAQELCKAIAILKRMPKYGASIRDVYQEKQETIAAGLLEIENLSKEHLDRINTLQTEKNKCILELHGQLMETEQERSVIETQGNVLQFRISEMKSRTLHKLCREGNMKSIKAYVDRLDDVVCLAERLGSGKGAFGYTPLHEAAANGKPEVLSYLLTLTGSANVNCRTRVSGYTPLHLAAINGHDQCVRELLVHGADISCVDQYGKTPKQAASKHRVVRLLRSAGESTCFGFVCRFYLSYIFLL
jgi:serine/threonine protein kinase